MRRTVWVRGMIDDFTIRRQICVMLNAEFTNVEEVVNTDVYSTIFVSRHKHISVVIGSLLQRLEKRVQRAPAAEYIVAAPSISPMRTLL